MRIFDLFCINIALICFPLTLYIIFITFKKNFKKKEKDVILELILYVIELILIYFYSRYQIREFVCCLTIPVLIAFLYQKPITAFSLSILHIFYFIAEKNNNAILIILLFITYFILYYYYNKTTKDKIFLTNNYLLFSVIYIILYIILYSSFNTRSISIIILFVITTYIVTFLINKVGTLLKTYKTLDELKEDRNLKETMCKISHEIKNPLIVIKGYLEVLDYEEIIKSKNNLINEVNYALEIIGDFKDLNHLKMNKTEFKFNEIIEELKYSIIPFYSNKHIKCIYNYDDDIIIYADKKRIKQVLINIIKNSIESIEYKGIIKIDFHKTNNNLSIIIKDNGKGIDKDTLDHLFAPFYTKKKCGTGLGLCLSKEIIEAHKGTIKCYSEIDKYTEIKISLPINNMDYSIDCNMD